jgi:hypothetical protein
MPTALRVGASETINRKKAPAFCPNCRFSCLNWRSRRKGIRLALTNGLPALEPPGETSAIALAHELQLDPDLLLAMAGNVSSELQTIIRKRPKLFAELIRALKDQPDHAVLRIVREVRDGNWEPFSAQPKPLFTQGRPCSKVLW